MKTYEFPIIEHIDDVLPAIADSNEFIVAEKEDFTFIQYAVSGPDTFGKIGDLTSHLRRECRGLLFDKNGKILSRRFHKFFNIGEKEETHTENIDLSKRHTIMEKLDGSMVTPVVIDGKVYWATKQGFSEVASTVMKWLDTFTHNYNKLALAYHSVGYTPIFEFCAPFNRIAVEYEEPTLVLLALRNNITGVYASHTELVCIGEDFNIPVVKVHESTRSLKDFLEYSKNLKHFEGFIIDFDGHKVKTKSDWYLRIHRTIDLFCHKRHLANLVLHEMMDDAKSNMDDYRKNMAIEFEEAFNQDVLSIVDRVVDTIHKVRNMSRADFAQSTEYSNLEFFGRIVFRNWSDNNNPDTAKILAEVKDVLIKKLTTNINYDTIEPVWLPNTHKVRVSSF